MTGKKSILGALALSALIVCAFTASSASASTLHECTKKAENSTAQSFTSSTCATKGEGEFRTTPIVGSKTILPTLTATKFSGTVGEKEGTHAVLHVVVGGISFRITCGKVTSPNSIVENKEPSAGVMVYEGSGKTKFEECVVENPVQCSVPATLETAELVQSIIDNKETGEMKVVFKPKEGTTFITIPVEGATCPEGLKGPKPINGEAVATVEEEGKSLGFNSTSGNNLQFGGVKGAQFTAKIHFSTTDGTPLVAETP